jgi:putative hydrolase of the HAD superfamily
VTIKALMVDVDGVVARRPDGTLWNRDALADIGLDPKAFQERFFAVHWPEIVLGRADLHDRLEPVLAEIAPHLTSRQVADYWFEQDGHLDHALLEELAGYRARGLELHLATVQEHHRARHLWDTLALREQFHAMHYAAALGCKKPEPAFFEAVTARTGFAPGELVLIDDAPANVAGAKACGWGAVLWTGERRLTEVLAEVGL